MLSLAKCSESSFLSPRERSLKVRWRGLGKGRQCTQTAPSALFTVIAGKADLTSDLRLVRYSSSGPMEVSGLCSRLKPQGGTIPKLGFKV
jgi:hypothetical protein